MVEYNMQTAQTLCIAFEGKEVKTIGNNKVFVTVNMIAQIVTLVAIGWFYRGITNEPAINCLFSVVVDEEAYFSTIERNVFLVIKFASIIIGVLSLQFVYVEMKPDKKDIVLGAAIVSLVFLIFLILFWKRLVICLFVGYMLNVESLFIFLRSKET